MVRTARGACGGREGGHEPPGEGATAQRGRRQLGAASTVPGQADGGGAGVDQAGVRHRRALLGREAGHIRPHVRAAILRQGAPVDLAAERV